MNMSKIKENKLKMILQFYIPSIIAMLLETVITITDGYFTGNYVGENEALYQFIKRIRLERNAWRLKVEKGKRKLSEQKVEESSFSHGIPLDDPSTTDENHCMYELCQTISTNHPALKDSGILTNCFEGGKYALYHFKGYPQLLFMVYQDIV